MEQLEAVTAFFKANPMVLKKLNETFGKVNNIDILDNISQNKKLFLLYARTDCKKFTNILEAFENTATDDIIIYFAELELYGVFKLDDYFNFCKMINEKLEDGDINISLNQLILADQKQKLVFCTIDGSIDKIRKYVKEYIGADISVNEVGNKVEITVLEPTATDFNNAREIYDKLYNYIYKKDKTTASNLNSMQLLRERDGYNYINPVVNDTFNAQTMEELVKILKSVVSGNNNNIILNIGGNNVINNITKIKVDKYSEAKNWIENNPPEERESTSEYYDNYKKVMNGKHLTIQGFTKCVTDMGYKKLHGKVNYWVNK